jgi:hypothetical protein
MFRNRLFNISIALALLILIGLTAYDAMATTSVLAQSQPSAVSCQHLPLRTSIHVENVQGVGHMTFTHEGPTGVDGGLIQLLSDYRTCSR